jgi:hypothetical protein
MMGEKQNFAADPRAFQSFLKADFGREAQPGSKSPRTVFIAIRRNA